MSAWGTIGEYLFSNAKLLDRQTRMDLLIVMLTVCYAKDSSAVLQFLIREFFQSSALCQFILRGKRNATFLESKNVANKAKEVRRFLESSETLKEVQHFWNPQKHLSVSDDSKNCAFLFSCSSVYYFVKSWTPSIMIHLCVFRTFSLIDMYVPTP